MVEHGMLRSTITVKKELLFAYIALEIAMSINRLKSSEIISSIIAGK